MPATEQLNIRVTPEVKERFRTRALREGMSQAKLLEALLKQRGTLPAPEPAAEPDKQPSRTALSRNGDADGSGSAPETVDFATWLSGRIRTPKALCARAVRGGRVTVAGVPYTAERIPKNLLAQPVVYEGKPV